MKLIREEMHDVQLLINEEKDGKKSYFVEGIFLQGAIKNRNGRTYPINVLEREVARYIKENIEKNRGYGELGHPSGPNINLERVSHMIKSLRQEGTNFIGKAKILDTPYGQIVKNLIDEGACLGVSSRGLGTLKENKNGVMEVQSDFMLSTAADIVADPSAQDAFVNGVMEGVEWIYDNGILKVQEIEKIRNDIKKATSKNLQEEKVKAFEKFLKMLSSR